jgi:arsenate reductase (glutaredoxin)
MTVRIYHNPGCGTSRNTLALIRAAGIEPEVVEYLKTPPSRDELVSLIARMRITPRDLVRRKGELFAEMGLDDAALEDSVFLDAMAAHPVLINRPIVVGPRGVKLCRPSELVLEVLDRALPADFVKEDGEVVKRRDAEGRGRTD